MLETHDEHLPAVRARAKSVRRFYRMGKYAGFLVMGNFAVATQANLELTGLELIANNPAWMGITTLGIHSLGVLGRIHTAIREIKWGFSVSSLQHIYRDQATNHDASNELVCINCGCKLASQHLSKTTTGKLHMHSHGDVGCPGYGFRLWPHSSKMSKFFLSVAKPI